MRWNRCRDIEDLEMSQEDCEDRPVRYQDGWVHGSVACDTGVEKVILYPVSFLFSSHVCKEAQLVLS